MNVFTYFYSFTSFTSFARRKNRLLYTTHAFTSIALRYCCHGNPIGRALFFNLFFFISVFSSEASYARLTSILDCKGIEVHVPA